MKLRCPKCQTVNQFDDGEALRCDSCGFDGKRIEGISPPGSTSAPVAPTPAPVAPTQQAMATQAMESELAEPEDDPFAAQLEGPFEAETASPDWPEEEAPAWDDSAWPEEEEILEQKTDGFSVAALVMGLLPPLCLLAIIFGGVGISRCNKHAELKGKGMAIAGLILGILGLIGAIGAILYTTSLLDGYI